MNDAVELEHRRIQRGRPGKDTRYRRIERYRLSATCEVDTAAVAYDATSDSATLGGRVRQLAYTGARSRSRRAVPGGGRRLSRLAAPHAAAHADRFAAQRG